VREGRFGKIVVSATCNLFTNVEFSLTEMLKVYAFSFFLIAAGESRKQIKVNMLYLDAHTLNAFSWSFD